MLTKRLAHRAVAPALLMLMLMSSKLNAAEPNQVGIVIHFPDGEIVTRCIEFSEAEITGYDVIARSGLAFEADFSNIGAAICKIGGTGCDLSECLTCDMPNYWAYWHWEGSDWQYAREGAGNSLVHHGDVEGWRWGNGEVPSAAFTFDDICASPTETPSPTNTPIATALAMPDVQFWIDGDTVKAGTCTTVHWVAKNVTSAQLNGDPVGEGGFVTTCPCEATDYELTVVYRDGNSETRKVTLATTGTCAAAAPVAMGAETASDTPTPQPTARPQSASAVTATVSPTPKAASEIPATPQPTSQPTPTPSPTEGSPTPQPDAGDVLARNTEEPGTPTSPAPLVTPTRATVEGFSQDDTAAVSLLNDPIMTGALFFGIVLAVVGASYLVLLRRR